jgi:hypothetical protein
MVECPAGDVGVATAQPQRVAREELCARLARCRNGEGGGDEHERGELREALAERGMGHDDSR